MSDTRISVVIPLYKSSATIRHSLLSLVACPDVIHEIILVDDACPENSGVLTVALAHELLAGASSSIEIVLVSHEINRGLAAAYNSGLTSARSELAVLHHPDIVIDDKNHLLQLVAPFCESRVVLTTHINGPVTPQYWSSLNLWEQLLLVPAQGSGSRGFNGQFDGVRISAWKSVTGFDEVHFLNAGEDGDFVRRMGRIGEIKDTNSVAQHQHNFQKDFRAVNYLDKAIQYGNAQGTLLRRSRSLGEISSSVFSLHREAIVLLIFIGIIQKQALLLIGSVLALSGSSMINPYKMFRINRRIGEVFRTFPLEMIKHFVHSFGSSWGFIRGRQTLSRLPRLFSDV